MPKAGGAAKPPLSAIGLRRCGSARSLIVMVGVLAVISLLLVSFYQSTAWKQSAAGMDEAPQLSPKMTQVIAEVLSRVRTLPGYTAQRGMGSLTYPCLSPPRRQSHISLFKPFQESRMFLFKPSQESHISLFKPSHDVVDLCGCLGVDVPHAASNVPLSWSPTNFFPCR